MISGPINSNICFNYTKCCAYRFKKSSLGSFLPNRLTTQGMVLSLGLDPPSDFHSGSNQSVRRPTIHQGVFDLGGHTDSSCNLAHCAQQMLGGRGCCYYRRLCVTVVQPPVANLPRAQYWHHAQLRLVESIQHHHRRQRKMDRRWYLHCASVLAVP